MIKKSGYEGDPDEVISSDKIKCSTYRAVAAVLNYRGLIEKYSQYAVLSSKKRKITCEDVDDSQRASEPSRAHQSARAQQSSQSTTFVVQQSSNSSSNRGYQSNSSSLAGHQKSKANSGSNSGSN